MIDSATALARSPLFSQLSRIELAKLAGELEELEFAPGAALVREGEPGDAFYVVKSGEAEVYVGEYVADAVHPILIGPGEGFGEIALLANSPRTASVRARTEVWVWRLPAERFRTLLDRDRSMATSIERTLSLRLTTTSHEAAELRHSGQNLAKRALRHLDPESARLAGLIGMLPHWNVDVLTRLCERSGYLESLQNLEHHGVFIYREGDRFVVPIVLADSFAHVHPGVELEWIHTAGHVLEEMGALVDAVDLYLRSGAYGRAEHLLDHRQDAIVERVTHSQVHNWLAHVGDDEPGVALQLELLQNELHHRQEAGESLIDIEAMYDSDAYAMKVAHAEAQATAAVGLFHHIRSKRLLGLVLALAFFVTGWLVPAPEMVGRSGVITLGALCATVPLLLFDVLPEYAVAIVFATVLVVPGIVAPNDILGGYGTSAWLFILVLFAIGAAIARTGLLYRAALFSLEHLPANFAVQSAVLAAVGIILTAGVASGSARIALAAPATRGIADALKFRRHSGGAVALGLITYLSFNQISTMFVTGSNVGLLLQGLLPEPAHSQFTWGYWFLASLAPNAILYALSLTAILLIYRPNLGGSVERRTIQTQRKLLGPLTRQEVVSIVVLILLMTGFMTQTYHGIPAVWISVAVFIALIATGALDRTTFREGVNWGQMVYLGVILSLADVFAKLRLDAWLSSLVIGNVQGLVANPYYFVLGIGVIAILLNLVLAWATASPLLALVTMPIAQSAGYSPFIPVIVALMAGYHWLFPYVNPVYLTMYFATDGELYSHDQVRPMAWLTPLFTLIALVASVPYWQFLSLI
ncbi:MAG: anion permease [Chloroflexi bacterium]|nr:anion permease [Chloroflexota bacterium]